MSKDEGNVFLQGDKAENSQESLDGIPTTILYEYKTHICIAWTGGSLQKGNKRWDSSHRSCI